MATRSEHWNDRFRSAESDQRSWYTPEAETSLAVIDRLGISPNASVIDVGGGDSVLVDRLVGRGFSDLTVLDVSQVALDLARQRVGAAAQWQRADLLDWTPERRWDLWHDRAVFHFLTELDDQAVYRHLLHAAVNPGGHAIVATFASDGPTTCSGLPVQRYTPGRLGRTIADGFTLVHTERQEHATPWGTIQPFTWAAFRRDPTSS